MTAATHKGRWPSACACCPTCALCARQLAHTKPEHEQLTAVLRTECHALNPQNSKSKPRRKPRRAA